MPVDREHSTVSAQSLLKYRFF